MQQIKFRYLQYLHRNKVLITICFLIVSISTKGQLRDALNLENHDDKPYYFGIVLGYNSSHYNITHHPAFIPRDTIQSIESLNAGRVHLGIMVNWQMSRRFDVRFYPLNLIFSEKQFQYQLKIPSTIDNQPTQIKRVESIVMSFPLQVRLKSDRIGNFRVYSLAGIKYDYDLASNAGALNAEDMVKVKQSDFGIEGGIGFQFFFKYFILSPEIKFSRGVTNMHVRDESFKYSNVIDQMKSRMVLFSIHFEGGGN